MELGQTLSQNSTKCLKSLSLKFDPAKLDKVIKQTRLNLSDFTKDVNMGERSAINTFILLLFIFLFLYSFEWGKLGSI